eukprot:gene21829-28250_t
MKAFQQSVNISATGTHLLRKLHKQVLPFILRRLKTDVAKELPTKTIIDILCTLSPIQQDLYLSFQRNQNLSDDILERELLSLRENRTTATAADDSSEPAEQTGPAAFPPILRNRMHPLKALQYLKLLCVHPCLVTAEVATEL